MKYDGDKTTEIPMPFGIPKSNVVHVDFPTSKGKTPPLATGAWHPRVELYTTPWVIRLLAVILVFVLSMLIL